jgi:hypothetical protein
MTYKIRPYEAVNAAKEWVESEREARLKKANQTVPEPTTVTAAESTAATATSDAVKSEST